MPHSQRVIERKLLGADQDGKIIYKQFKDYFIAVPEDDLRNRVSSIGSSAGNSLKKFEKQLDEMLLASQ